MEIKPERRGPPRTRYVRIRCVLRRCLACGHEASPRKDASAMRENRCPRCQRFHTTSDYLVVRRVALAVADPDAVARALEDSLAARVAERVDKPTVGR